MQQWDALKLLTVTIQKQVSKQQWLSSHRKESHCMQEERTLEHLKINRCRI